MKGLRSRGVRRAILSLGLVTLGVLALLTRLGGVRVTAERVDYAWPLTSDGQSRFAAWSADSRTVLVNRWGRVVGGGTTSQTLSELWAVGIMGDSSTSQRTGQAVKYSGNAIQPAYGPDGRRLAYLTYVGNAGWEARVLDLVSGRETARGAADWRMGPVWVGDTLAFARECRVWLSSEGASAVAAERPALPPRAQVRLSGDGTRAAWSEGTDLWAVRMDGISGEPRLLAADTQVLSFAWSPDGRQLAYIVASEGPTPELWTADAEGRRAPLLLAQGESELFSAPSWSPDGRTLAFSRTPMGAATASGSDIWLVDAGGENRRPLLCNDLEESSPAWSPHGRYLAFNRAGNVWVLDMTCASARAPTSRCGPMGSDWEREPIEDLASLDPPAGAGVVVPLAQRTPPITIRVKHVEENTCRAVPEGQIDVIEFEEYVAKVVAKEVYPGWPIEALKAQAVAARTFGWKHVLIPSGSDWDVTDWTGHQAMCDNTYSSTDAAVQASEGQYLAWLGEVIYANYSAENGSPTRTCFTDHFPDGVPYLTAVDDPVSFGQPVRTHGCGLSQWGAQRWAEWHGWDYQQILAHYYTDVTIELPSNGGPLPIGGVTLPWSDYFVTSNRAYIAANASDEDSAVSEVGFYAVTDTRTLLVTDTVGSDGWSTVWNVATLTDTVITGITLSLVVADVDGDAQSQNDTVRIGLDRHPPRDPTAAIDGAYTDALTITLSSLSAADPNPGSGVQEMAFSNEGWTWEGEDLYREEDSGTEVDDEGALNGRARCGFVGEHSAGSWYGPYTYDLPPRHAYRAYFRLRTDNVNTTDEVAMLDVVDKAGERLLGLRRLRGTDFRQAHTYQEFPVDFNYTDPGDIAGLEFRTSFRAATDLCLDRVLIVGYPVTLTSSVRWRLTDGDGQKDVTIKFIDGAGNVSADLRRTVAVDTSPPMGWRDFTPRWWSGGDAPTCTVSVFDEVSGLNVDSARYHFSTDGGLSWSDWATAACTGISGTTDIQTITAFAVPYGQPRAADNRIEFQIGDIMGHTGSMSYTVRGRPTYLPLILHE